MWWIALASLPSAEAGLTERSYERAIDLIGGLYLYPNEVDAHAMLRQAAESLAEELDWLMVETQGNAVNLRHGDGTLIGSVSVASLETLPAGLLALEELVAATEYPVGDVDVRLELLKGMTRALDRYSRVLSGDGLDRFDVRLKGTLVGVGLNLAIVDDQLVVTRLNARGPAELGGVRVGDVVVRIDGRSTVNMPTREATRLIRGEEGTPVVFTVRRDGEDLDLSLTRAEVVVPNVESQVLEGGVGLVEISHVSQRTVDNLLAELESLRSQGALERGLIVDLRGNTGGSMKESAHAVDEFVDAGMLLRTAGPDGERVKNLQARMDAEPGGAVPPIPVVVLVDERTASGAEIVAGSLVELDRAAVVGTRTYGKGTVQKIYPLDEDTKLKLTVAQYLLEHDRVIADEGVLPDVVVGEIELDGYGVHFDGWDTAHLRTSWDAIVPWVQEAWSWRQQDVPDRNVVVEVARRAVLDARGPGRPDVLASLRAHADALRAEEQAHLVEALAARGIDWSPAEQPPGAPDVRVTLTSAPDPAREDVIRVVAELENRGDAPLHRALLELSSDFAAWDGLVLPVGRVEPGATVAGEVAVALHAGVNPREDRVEVRLRADGVEPKGVGEGVLHAESSRAPRVSVTLRLEDRPAGKVAVAEVTNGSKLDVEGVEVHFGYPGDVDVELVDQAARVPVLKAGATHRFELGVKPGPLAPAVLPLQIVVETPRYGELVTWPVDVPMDGSPVVLQPPRVRATVHPLHAPAGPFEIPLVVTDDGRLEHVVVYRNGQKVAWAAGDAGRVELAARLELEAGVNRLLVVTRDDRGLEEREQFVVRGVPSDAAVEAPPAPEGREAEEVRRGE